MSARKGFSAEEARQVGEDIGIDWDKAPFDVEQFRRGMEVELEHGLQDPATNVTDTIRRSPPRSRSRTSMSFPTTTRGSSAWSRKPSADGAQTRTRRRRLPE